jgi:hypothetical protein
VAGGYAFDGWQATTPKEFIMQGKLALAAGFAAGYVLGSKAGRQRYEEIVAQARKVADNQTVQSTAGVLQAQASDLVSKAKQNDLVNKAVSKVKRGDDRPSSTDSPTTVTSSTYSTPATAAYVSDTDPLSTPSTTSSTTPSTTSTTDLFEPGGSTADPLNPTNPSSTNGSNP